MEKKRFVVVFILYRLATILANEKEKRRFQKTEANEKIVVQQTPEKFFRAVLSRDTTAHTGSIWVQRMGGQDRGRGTKEKHGWPRKSMDAEPEDEGGCRKGRY